MFPSIAIILKKMGVTLFSKSSMDFFYSAVKKIKDEHKESEVCLSLFHYVTHYHLDLAMILMLLCF